MDRHQQSSRTLQETVTTLPAADVLQAAKTFFARRNPIYAAFLEKEGPTHAAFRGQGGEEITVGTMAVPGGTRVTASTYMFDQQVARFFATLPPAPPESASASAAGTAGPTATTAAQGAA
jgi:hypothetical protein